MLKVFFISLGCAKNLVDSEYMLGLIKEEGYDIADDLAGAEIAIVNTCAFIKPAVEESIDTILELVDSKRDGNLKSIVVAGCFVQRYGRKLLREIPEVDAWLGTGQIYRIQEILKLKEDSSPALYINNPSFLADHRVPRVRTTPFYSAYLKIAEGCSHRCSYCIIPSLRGAFRSRTIDSLFIEAREMVEKGVMEINLVAQDTSSYGHDLDSSSTLESLLKKLLTISGLKWLRVLYAYPNSITEGLLDLIDSEERLCPYLDVPLQHVNPHILESMRRPVISESIPELIERIRRRSRHIAIRTTMLIGFPGETDEQFRELCDFVGEIKFDRMGVFPFCQEKGTPAAGRKDVIPAKVVDMRVKEIMKIQKGIMRELNKELVGKTLPVLVEGFSSETDLLLSGRTATMAPEIDGRILINEGSADVGEIVPVEITESHPYDLVGRIK
jgi:ribosomal protein S12 methylthiotransferase